MEVTFNGQAYPIKLTMGAIIDFKHLTGKDPSKIAADDVEGLTVLCYCCLCSATRAAGREFPFSFQQFADACSIDELNAMNFGIAEQQESEAAKKKQLLPRTTRKSGNKA